MQERVVTLVGGPENGRTLTVTVPHIELADEGWSGEGWSGEGWSGEGPVTVHTYSVRQRADGTFFGRYDGSRPA